MMSNRASSQADLLVFFFVLFPLHVSSSAVHLDFRTPTELQIAANERKRTKEERDLINRTKVFARVQTAEDAEVFVDGLLCTFTIRTFCTRAVY